MPPDALILTRQDVRALLDVDTCIAAVEGAFLAHGRADTPPPAILAVHVDGGGFHVKAGVLQLERAYYAAKSNGNFPDNPARFGLPTIQGVIMLADATCGTVLAVMDSAEITALRTAAASAVAAKYLARPGGRVAGIVGCGVQGAMHARALVRVHPLERVVLYDRDPQRAATLARQLRDDLSIDVTVADRIDGATRSSDIVATCTTSHEPILYSTHVGPGTFIAAAGADNPEKQEIDARGDRGWRGRRPGHQ